MADAKICHVCGAENPPNARYCNQCGTFLDIVSESAGSSTTEERRWVTMLFADLENYTGLLERMDPEDARELVSECFSGLAHEIVQLGGTVDKFMGDAVMAIFGAPITHEDDPGRALRAALRMQRFMERFNSKKGLGLHLRIGLNTGQVVVGARRVGGLVEYTATGDAVNVAARLQQVAQPGQIVAGEDTVLQAGSAFQTDTLPPLQLRGKQERVTAFLLMGEKDATIGPALGAGPMVNRTRDLARLSRRLRQLAGGRGGIILLTGEAGIGKSRLIYELRAAAAPTIVWRDGRGQSHRAGSNYSIFRSVSEQIFGLRDIASPDARADRVRSELELLGTPQAYPFLARLLNLPAPAGEYEALAHLAPEQIEQRVLREIGAMVEAGAKRKPNLLVIDDLHWADPSSITLVNSFLELTTRVPLGLLLSFRLEPGTPVARLHETALRDYRHWTTDVPLEPLTAYHSRALVQQLMGNVRPSASIRSIVEAQGEGNPLFIEEMVQSLREDDASASEPDSVQSAHEPTATALVRVPSNIQGIMLARLDRLPEPTRHSLQVAAVIGREFDPDLLEAVDPAANSESLLPAVQTDLLTSTGPTGSGHLAFRHALTREVIYRTLLLRRRRVLHGRVAEAIIRRAPEPDEEAATLAFHFLEAQRWSEAVRYASLAGDHASQTFASPDAVLHYTQALAALDRLDGIRRSSERARLLRARAAAHERTGEWQSARTDYEAALELAKESNEREPVLLALGRLLTDHDEYEAALSHVRRALEETQRVGDRRGAARALSLEARILVRRTRPREAVERLNRALAVHRELGDRRGEAEALDNLAAPLSLLGDVEGAYEHQRAALEIFLELGDRESEADVRSVLAEWRWFLGDFEGALIEARVARTMHDELGVHRYRAHDDLVEGMALATLGRFRDAIKMLEQAARVAEQTDQPQWVAHALVPLGVVNRALGRYRRARQAFHRAQALGRSIGATYWTQLGTIGLGLTAYEDGDLSGAEERFRAIMEAPDGLQFSRARAMTGLAMVELARGELEVADDWARWSIAITEGAPYVEALLEAQIVRGRTLAGLGDVEGAQQLLRQVITRARSTGARPLRVSASRALADINGPAAEEQVAELAGPGVIR